MPLRVIDTRFIRLLETRRHLSARPGRPLPNGPTQPPDEDERARTPIHRPFDDWPFDFEPLALVPDTGGR
jgi:hypothetical protein